MLVNTAPESQSLRSFAPTIEGVGHPFKGRHNLQNFNQFSLGKVRGPYVVTKITVFETSQGKGKRVSHQLISIYCDKSWGLGGSWDGVISF